jgi:hypothetical protein
LLASGSASAQRPDGISYHVDVKTSFGFEFSDCFIFGEDGILEIAGFGFPLAFDQANLGTHEVFWQAVTITGAPFQLAINGMATGNSEDGMLKGNAINDFGDTLTIKGSPADCAPVGPESAAATAGFNWVQ